MKARNKGYYKIEKVKEQLREQVSKALRHQLMGGRKKKVVKKASRILSKEQKMSFWEKKNALTDKYLPKVQDLFVKMFQDQRKKTLPKLDSFKGFKIDPNVVYEAIKLDEATETAISLKTTMPVFEELFKEAGDETFEMLEVEMTMDVARDEVQDLLKTKGRILAKGVTETTNNQIKKQVIEGLAKGEAIDDERDTDFENGTLFGMQIGFLPRMPKTIQSPYFETRYGIELRVQEHALTLDWDGLNVGDVHVNSAMFAFKLFQMPKKDGVFGFHLEAGMGWGTTWFEKDDMLKQDDVDHGRHTKIDVSNASIFAFGAGADLYVAPDACVTLGFRFQILDIPVKWSVDGVYDRNKERLNASNGQVYLSFNFFF